MLNGPIADGEIILPKRISSTRYAGPLKMADMEPAPGEQTESAKPAPRRRSFALRCCGTGCGGLVLFFLLFIGAGFLLLQKAPKSYPLVANPIEAASAKRPLGGGLDGFNSPYLGHTGSWDGKGGGMFGKSKVPELEVERGMGLRWTFMAVYWRALEPQGPVDLSRELPPEWKELDDFVIQAQRRGLNILMQAPVMGGNAGGPPEWVGRREPGRSAPTNMQAAAEVAGKLARRYCPDGVLARRQGWGSSYGVRAWELDNEPESYRAHWKGQAADYAEFVTRLGSAIKTVDPQAVIVLPGVAGGGNAMAWLEGALDAPRFAGSAPFRERGQPYSIGKWADVVSFHCYEGLETAFSRSDRTIERDFSDVRGVFEKWERRVPGFEYARKQEYWHTEGNYDFFGVMSAERRAAWRFQFMTRAFAAGIRKVCVMDASPAEQIAVRAYVRALPDPFPMIPATKEVQVLKGQAMAFEHPNGEDAEAARVWIVWAVAGTGDALVEVPVRHGSIEAVGVDGRKTFLTASGNRVRVELKGDKKMAPGALILDRPAKPN